MSSVFNLFKHWKRDLPASIVVFLVALPLCLGIALASGAPLISGIIAGIIAGIVVGSLSGSHLSVSGPAAGLTVIVLNAISDLGGFEMFLTATVLAGIIQIIMGRMKAGIVGMYFPSSVIKGMLAAIGLILIMKQIPHLIGVDSDAFGEMEFLQRDGNNTFSFLAFSLDNFYLGSMIVGMLSLLVLIIWEQPIVKKNAVLKKFPGALVAVALGLGLSFLIKSVAPEYTITAEHLVNLPDLYAMDDPTAALIFPDFSALKNIEVYIVAVTIAIVASLETLLSVEAVDKLDPHKRKTPQNRELLAQGVGNTLSGLIGGLPMTAVIVRSTANLESKAKTKMSAIYHGIFLLLAIGFFARFLNYIPLASLAAILILVGFKLSKPSLYMRQFKLGKQQFVPFIVTVVAILFTDLLIGILIGMAVGIFYILRANYQMSHVFHQEEHETNGQKQITIELSEHVTFLNKANLTVMLRDIPDDSSVIIDGSKTRDIDYDVLEILQEFQESLKDRNIELKVQNVQEFVAE